MILKFHPLRATRACPGTRADGARPWLRERLCVRNGAGLGTNEAHGRGTHSAGIRERIVAEGQSQALLWELRALHLHPQRCSPGTTPALGTPRGCTASRERRLPKGSRSAGKLGLQASVKDSVCVCRATASGRLKKKKMAVFTAVCIKFFFNPTGAAWAESLRLVPCWRRVINLSHSAQGWLVNNI